MTGGTKPPNDRVHPPDKKRFERETADLNRQIKELEVKLVSFEHMVNVLLSCVMHMCMYVMYMYMYMWLMVHMLCGVVARY